MEWIVERVDSSVLAATHWLAPQDDPFVGACVHGNVQVLHWLLTYGFQLDVDKAGKYLEYAGGNQVDVLDWLISQLAVTPLQLKSAFTVAFRKARSTQVLDWWKNQLDAHGIGVRSTVADTWDTQSHCDSEMWDWWLNRAGSFTTFQPTFGGPCTRVCGKMPAQCTPTSCLAILQLWHDAGLDLNPVECIKAASIMGNLEALDWFLGKVPAEVFVEALTSCAHIPGVVPRCTYSAKSLLWWWANVPQVRGWTGSHSNCGQMENSISAHIVSAMIKLPNIPMCDVKLLSQRGNVAMLRYIKDCRKDLLDRVNVDAVLVAASQGARVGVLDWWKTQSGLHISACPQSIVAGQVGLDENARAWWLQSGLCPDGIAEFVDEEDDEDDW